MAKDNNTIINVDTPGAARVVTNLTMGPPGPTGDKGDNVEWHTHAGVPTVGLGQNGDMCLDTTTGDVYYKDSNGWSLQANIKGPQGDGGNVDGGTIT